VNCGSRWSLLALIITVGVACADADVLPGCGDGICFEDESLQTCALDCDFDVVVVVEAALLEPLDSQLDAYLHELSNERFRGYVVGFEPAPVSELRALLAEQLTLHNIESAFLVGNLPVAWYEQRAFDEWEEFPTDLYLDDLDATFADTDGDEVFDTHSGLRLEISTSRVMGEVADLQRYFDRVNRARREGPIVDPSAFVFIDDDWASTASTYQLDDLYRTVDLVSDPGESTLDNYVQRLTEHGAEFVLQMMHSGVTYLVFEGVGGGMLRSDEIRDYNFRSSFVHLWNCFSGRFVRDSNLAMIYTVENDRGLAAIGSTKKGAVRRQEILHGRLAQNETVGEAFRYWYNSYGHTDDTWALGIVVFGDPMLTVWGDVTGMLERRPPGDLKPETLEMMDRVLAKQPTPPDLDTFEDYKVAHPEFFRD